ncbi:MAG: hypothetical protein QOJ94_1734 [Sphingomonadales bacterium]|jgi:hypothetical protein|nr:hypothetical protein [Sphingomonadales bacterium]
MLGDPLESRLRSRLLPGERVLWTGRPVQGLAVRRNDLWIVPLTIFAVFLALQQEREFGTLRPGSFDPFFAIRTVVVLGGGFYVAFATPGCAAEPSTP